MGVAPDVELQSAILPLPSSEAFSFVTIAGPNGSQACSCSRIIRGDGFFMRTCFLGRLGATLVARMAFVVAMPTI